MSRGSTLSPRVRLAMLASLAAIVVVIAAAIALSPAAAPFAIVSPTAVPSPVATSAGLWVGPAPTMNEAVTRRPSTTCRVLRTPEPNNPPHAPANGQPNLGVPTRSGMILIQIAQCRDIQAVLVKYGLAGPATRAVAALESDEMIANGATRWYLVEVTPGTESATVVEL